MWRKVEDNNPKPSPAASPSPPSSIQPPGTAAQVSPNTPTAVNHGIKIKGEISGQGDFFLDGDFEGKISLAGGSFRVGPNARVNAEIEAREVVIRGEVIGALKACEHVYIGSTGKLTGNMETRGIVIEDGAVLHSKVAVPRAAVPEAAAPEPSADETDRATQPAPPESLPRARGAASTP